MKKKIPYVIQDHREQKRKEFLLPEPKCIHGYPYPQIASIMKGRLRVFLKWMEGQTGCICPGHSDGCEYNADGNGSHSVVYEDDVVRFLKGLPIID